MRGGVDAQRQSADDCDAGFSQRCAQLLRQGQPLSDLWQESRGLGAMIRLPQVQGIIRSLVGPDPLYDHHAFHRVPAGHLEGQVWHADAIIDTRLHFDIQLFYFPHDTPREMGGTMFLPGSHLRRIHETVPRTRILVLTVHEEEEYVLPLVRAGASGYLVKDSAVAELLAAVRALHAGQGYFGPQAARVLGTLNVT